LVQRDPVDDVLEAALDTWRVDRDPRRLRRELLKLLADLEDAP
jgi:hypothetical protein